MKNGVPKGAPFFTYSPQNEQNTPMALNHFNNWQSKEYKKSLTLHFLKSNDYEIPV